MLSDFETALKRLHNAGKKRFGDQWVQKLERRRAKMEGAYATLFETDRDPIPYLSLSAQTVYVFAYAPARAEYTRQFLLRHRKAFGKPLFDDKHVRVVSFGGGPASELVGLVRYLEDETTDEPVEAIEYVIYDKDGEWDTVATRITANLETDISVTISYDQVDAASRQKMGRIDLSEVDMVIFSYLMSELAKVGPKDQISENFRSTLAEMKIGSKILFIDNCHPLFIDYFRACKLVTGLMQKNDDDAPVDCSFDDMNGTFGVLSEALEWTPSTELRAVSKLIVRTRK